MAANTLPIFPLTPLNWHVKLSNQITPRDISTQVPVEFGAAGKNGSLIHTMFVQHLGVNVATVVRLYLKGASDDGYSLLKELTLPAVGSASEAAEFATINFALPPILPSGNTGLHLAPGSTLYLALGTAIVSGINVWAFGGEY